MQYNTIAELQNYIVLDNYVKSSIACEPPAGYQTEAALERELIDDLKNQGYEYVPEITSPDALLTNARKQLQTLNQVVFTDALLFLIRKQIRNKIIHISAKTKNTA